MTTDPLDVVPIVLRGPSETPLIFLDTETTGLEVGRHVPWEIAWIGAIHDTAANRITVDGSFQCFRILNDTELRAVDETALQIGGFVDRYVRSEALSDVEIAGMLAGTCGYLNGWTHGHRQVHLVGAVPSFDHAMLCSSILGWPGFNEGLWHYHLVDVETLAAGKLGMAPPYTGTSVADAFGVKISDEDRHTAMGDTRWALDLYAAVFGAEVVDPNRHR